LVKTRAPGRPRPEDEQGEEKSMQSGGKDYREGSGSLIGEGRGSRICSPGKRGKNLLLDGRCALSEVLIQGK